MKAFAAVMTVFVTLPIWVYLLYKVMQMVGATELMWFLFWIYVPASLIVRIAVEFAVKEGKK